MHGEEEIGMVERERKKGGRDEGTGWVVEGW